MTHAQRQQRDPDAAVRLDRGAQSRQYLERLVESGSAIEIPELAQDMWPAALYQVRDRGGVSVLVLRTSTLTPDQRNALLRFQFAQYAAAGFMDEEIMFGRRLEYDAWPSPRSGVHSVAFSASSGRILATLDLRGTPSPSGATPSSYDRPLLPIEERFGWGVFNRLRLLPDLPLDRIDELGRFAKNHSPEVTIGAGVRAAVEVCLGMARALTQALHLEVEAFIGEFEDSAARKHLEFLHTPMVVLRGGLPTVASDHHHRAGLVGRARYPFAVLVSDMQTMASRLQAVERALELPGDQALSGLLELKSERRRPRSSLEPGDGLAALANTPLPQCELSLPARLKARRAGHRLRDFRPLADLSEAEACALRTLLDREHFEADQVVLRRGSPSESLYLIDSGQVQVNRGSGLVPIALGPGEYFGEIGLLSGGRRTAEVVAQTELDLLRVGRDPYLRYLRELPRVDHELARVALARATGQILASPGQ
jgi:CRP-like cAMP-binding protein